MTSFEAQGTHFPDSIMPSLTAEACGTAPRLRARASDPITSHQAAANTSRFAASHAGRIVAALERIGSGTAQEIGDECGLTVVQVDRRLIELQRAGQALVLHGMDNKPVTRDGYRVWAGV